MMETKLKKELGIYVHIPFCKQKCLYCDFISFCNKDSLMEQYINCLKIEINNRLNKINTEIDYEITTIYIGGGTPSYLDSIYIEQILNEIKKCIHDLKSVKEITIEINPGTVTEKKIKHYKEIGINRLSIGLQETHNNLLKQIGRIHTFEEFEETYKLAKKYGFENINVDLMIGLPNQTIEDIKENIEKIEKINPKHVSIYSLILEEGTPLNELVRSGKLKLPDEEQERNMYWYVKNKLELIGFKHYEISNFSKEGFESKHNLNCWEQKEYLGFGVAAHSYYNGKRFSNAVNIEEYIKNIDENNNNIIIHEVQDKEKMQKEYMLLGLRKIDGISISKYKEKFAENPIMIYRNELNKLVENKLVIIDGDNIKLTNEGIDLANIVWEEFVD